MQRQYGIRALGFALLGLAAIGLVACGQTTSSGTGGESQASHASTGSASSGTPSGTPQTTSNSGGAPTPGQVTVTLVGTPQGTAQGTAQSYSKGAIITVEIANGLSSTITTTDHHTNCTMVTLEQQVGGAWQPVGKCVIMTATRMIPIAAGQVVKQELRPQNGMTNVGIWQAGTYRVAFSYSAGSNTETPGSGATIYSPTFTIS